MSGSRQKKGAAKSQGKTKNSSIDEKNIIWKGSLKKQQQLLFRKGKYPAWRGKEGIWGGPLAFPRMEEKKA